MLPADARRRPLRIAMLQETYLPIRGGAEMHVYYLSRALLRDGHSVEVFTTTPGGAAADDSPKLTRRRLHRGLLYPLRFPYWGAIVLRAALRNDVLHAHYSSFLAAMVVLVARLTGRRSVVTLHGFGTLESSVGRSLLRRAYRRLSLRFADRIIATSGEMADVAHRFATPEQIEVITNGVDTTAFAPAIRGRFDDISRTLKLLTLRRLVPKNGVHFAVQATEALAREMPLRLEIVGDGGLRELIRNRIADLGLEHVIAMHGALPPEQVVERLKTAHVALFLSTAESTSLAALECMARGCLVLASRVGAFPEFIEHGRTGFLVDIFGDARSNYDAPNALTPEQVRKVTDALRAIASTPPRQLEEIASRARAVVQERYDWNEIARRTVDRAYRGVAGA